jgi:alpha-amylase/alpha-mannosidase (GH57 family)
MRTFCLVGLLAVTAVLVRAQPAATPAGVEFVLRGEAASVSLVGDFNGWSRDENPLTRGTDGVWRVTRRLWPGVFQYLFLVDGTEYRIDPGNPVTIENYNNSGRNSAFVVTEDSRVLLQSTPPPAAANTADAYPPLAGKSTVYLNIIWHQHQPLYVNPESDQLQGPWVRTHATKDYYDMAAMLEAYPDIHCNINLTSSLLQQLLQYYVERLRPYVDTRTNRVDTEGLWKVWKGKTDPWIDLALTPTASFGDREKAFLYRNVWNAFGISEVQISRFPAYEALKKRWEAAGEADPEFTEQEMRELKFWFYLAHFDPDFLRGPVTITDGTVCDLSDLVERREGHWHLRRPVTEDDCNRIVAESYKVMANVVPVHRKLLFNPRTGAGQVDVITTPFYHPILPLIYDSDLARRCQPGDPLPPRFSYPEDADAQIARAVKMYREVFGIAPTGMWPGEGSVAQPVLPILRRHGILWTASDVKVLQRSAPAGRPNTTAYRFPAAEAAAGSPERWMALVFRDTELSDRIGFKYQNYRGEEAAEDFVQSIRRLAPASGEPDVLVTVILDGENAWEWYRQDEDAKEFLHAFYRKLTALARDRQVMTVTTTEYLTGNPTRGVPAHPMDTLPAMEELWPGSWINGNYDTWIGEAEENRAWEYLLRARTDLAAMGIPQPDPAAERPAAGTRAWNAWMAWEAMYAAEGSDWFWWYGADQSAPAGDQPFDVAFRTHLENVYRFAQAAGGRIASPGFDPIIVSTTRGEGGQGVMARSRGETRRVVFECDARAQKVSAAIYIVGGPDALGAWTPNSVQMRDDGKEGDAAAGDGIWTFAADLPIGEEVQYKYTNSGRRGEWSPSEEFAGRNRSLVVAPGDGPQTISAVFGE